MTGKNILLIEDERSVADLLVQGLEEDGFKAFHAMDYDQAMEALNSMEIHLVILDVLLPKMNGLEICRNLRSSGYTDLPILMVTALGSPENVVLGLDSGADDYLSKPFKLIELKARVRTLLRRKDEIRKQLQESDKKLFRYKFLEVDEYRKVAFANGHELNLTSTEYRLLLLFIKSPQKVFERTELLDKVWGINFDIGSNVVDVYVNYLRKKIERATPIKTIHTVIGMGYVMKIED